MKNIINQINDIFNKLDKRIKSLEAEVKEINSKKTAKKT